MLVAGNLAAGKYRVIRLLGSGGMGQVFEAIHEPLARRVALKTLLPEFAADPSLLARFRREAESAAGLGHPNIVQVNDFVSEPGEPPFIVMELLEGVTMRELLDRENKLAPQRAAFIGTQILSGLASAHRAGIIHRDIKPANVFLQSTLAMKDIVKIVDFGLAKLVIDLTKTMPGVTKNGQILGTLAYMSPEQASGAVADHRADIWAVGATLFHAVSGLRPFDVVELGKGKTTVASVAPWLDRGLAAVIDRALERQPEHRWSSAEEMASALAPYAAPTSGGPMPSNAPHATAHDMMLTGGHSASGSSIGGSIATAPTQYSARPSAYGPPPTPLAPPSYPTQHQQPYYAPPPLPPPVVHPLAFPPTMMADKTMKGWIIALIAVLALTFLVPIAMSMVTMFRSRELVANAQVEGEKRFVEAAKFPTCPAPDRCTEHHEDHGVTYPVCTNKLPKLNPPRFMDYVIVAGSPEKVAYVSSQSPGEHFTITYVMGGSGSDEITTAQVVGRLCRAGRSSSAD